MTVLFLDFDGVLHPNEVYLARGRNVELRADGHELFEQADLLVQLLEPHPLIQIVLSTSWVFGLKCFDEVKGRLPKALQDRVVGATWHSSMSHYQWLSMTRYEQIMTYVLSRPLLDWIAIDDNDEGWPEDMRCHLVHTDEWLGLSDLAAQEDLKMKLGKPFHQGD